MYATDQKVRRSNPSLAMLTLGGLPSYAQFYSVLIVSCLHKALELVRLINKGGV